MYAYQEEIGAVLPVVGTWWGAIQNQLFHCYPQSKIQGEYTQTLNLQEATNPGHSGDAFLYLGSPRVKHLIFQPVDSKYSKLTETKETLE